MVSDVQDNIKVLEMKSATVIGCGEVGSVIAYSLLGEVDRLYLVDTDISKVKGLALDIADASIIANAGTSIGFSSSVGAFSDAYIICIGNSNSREFDPKVGSAFLDIMNDIKNMYLNPLIIVVTNPTGNLSKLALNHFSHVYAAGRELDNARVRSEGMHEEQSFGTHFRHIKKGVISRFGIAAEVLMLLRGYR